MTTSTAFARRSIATRKPSTSHSTSAPAVASLSSTISRCWGRAPRTVTSPRVITAPTAQVPATMRSPTVAWVTGSRRRTPSISSVEVPAPLIRAPIRISSVHRSTISGSRAALSMTVTPLASTAAISTFSVAPTLGKSSQMVAAGEPVRGARQQEPVLAVHAGAQLLQAADVHVQAAGADRVAPRAGHVGLAAPRHQRAQDADRGPHAAYEVVVGLVPQLARHVDRHRRAGRGRGPPPHPAGAAART